MTASGTEGERVRVAELLASLSLACDLANGFPLEKALRNCIVSVGVAGELGLDLQQRSDAYYVGLLRSIGCTSFAFEESIFNGDDIDFRNTFAAVDFSRPSEVMGRVVRRLAAGSSPASRARAASRFLRQGSGFGVAMASSNCEAGARLARRLGMSDGVVAGLLNIYERWDGNGVPRALPGTEIPVAALLGNFGHVVTVVHRAGAREETLDLVRRRSDGEFPPDLVAAFIRVAPELLGAIEAESVWDAALEAEPEDRRLAARARVAEIAAAFGDFADLKSPYTLRHSAGVADLAAAAAALMGLADGEIETLRIAALLHDLGRVSVPNGIWDKDGPLTVSEWERVRLHPYYTERCLAQSPLLPYGRLAGMHHERLDESGYHRGFPAALLTTPARLLSGADAYHAMTQERAFRPALTRDSAAKELRGDVTAGKLDRDVVAAVLEAGGHAAATVRSAWPAGLTDREVDVLRLVARGLPNKRVAAELHISAATVHHHVLHVYQKIGVSTRAGAALFAMEHDLVRTSGNA